MRRKLSVLVTALIIAPLIGLASSRPSSRSPSGQTSAEGGPPSLTNVNVSNAGDFDEVVFTFAGKALPTVDATAKSPPFYNTAGDVVTVPGSSFVNVRMSPASGVDFGLGCATTVPLQAPARRWSACSSAVSTD